MRSKTLIWVAVIVGAILIVPKVLSRMRKQSSAPPEVANPPPQAPPERKRKKTVLGKIVGGLTDLSVFVPGQTGLNVKQGLGALDQFTV